MSHLTISKPAPSESNEAFEFFFFIKCNPNFEFYIWINFIVKILLINELSWCESELAVIR